MADRADLDEIAALVAAYNQAYDSGNVDAWVATFADDGVFELKSGEKIAGRDALREWFQGRPHTTIHVTANPQVERGAAGLAHRCTVIVFRRRDDGVELQSVGWYDDRLVRTGDGLRFIRRGRASGATPVRLAPSSTQPRTQRRRRLPCPETARRGRTGSC